jgi:Holliday junction DNA helicase RuvA
MITFLRGHLAESFPNRAVVDVGGVGYGVHIPISTYDALPGVGQPVRLLTHLQVREAAHDLYGFASEEERDLFRLLINQVSGIGPKLALAVLSGMPVATFKACVARNDLAALSRIKGVGKKTAERIVVELRDKVGVAAAWEAATAGQTPPLQSHASDAVLALVSLGYRQPDAHKAVEQFLKDTSGEPGTDVILRGALRSLTS